MSTFDPGLIAEIKARLRIEDVIGRHVELRPAGSRLVAPCPFHQETKPSFSVNPEGGFYYCFGCQASGDIIEFYRAINGLEFGEAVEALAREAGLDVRRRPEYRAPASFPVPSAWTCTPWRRFSTGRCSVALRVRPRGITSRGADWLPRSWSGSAWAGLRRAGTSCATICGGAAFPRRPPKRRAGQQVVQGHVLRPVS
jgi:hypothetical protein